MTNVSVAIHGDKIEISPVAVAAPDEHDKLMGRIEKMLFLMADAVRCMSEKTA